MLQFKKDLLGSSSVDYHGKPKRYKELRFTAQEVLFTKDKEVWRNWRYRVEQVEKVGRGFSEKLEE